MIKELELNIEDINILIEAVHTWENRDFSGELMSGLFETLLIKDEKVLAEIKIKKEQEKLKKEQQKQQDKEKAELLRVKLVLLKQELFKKELPQC